MYRSKSSKKIKQEDLLPVKGVLDKVFHDLDLDTKSQDYTIMQAWAVFTQANTSATIARNTFAHRINQDRKLVIGVRSAVLANELQFIKAKLEQDFMACIETIPRKINGLVFELRN
jgi:hypothetical protein